MLVQKYLPYITMYINEIYMSSDPIPVCKFEFARCGPVEKTRAPYLSRFSRGSPTKSSGVQISKSQN